MEQITKNNVLNYKRIEYVDIMKSFGMLLVIWAHIMTYGTSTTIIYSFHMPLFFFLSGLMFKKAKYKNIKVFISRRIKTLLIPYFIFSFVMWIIWLFWMLVSKTPTESYINPLLQTFIAQGSGGFMVHDVTLWFITCLFVVEIIYFFISNFSFKFNVLLSIACAFVGCWMLTHCNLFNFKLLPWNLEVALVAMPFYAAGNYIIEQCSYSQIEDKIYKNKGIFSLLFFLSVITVCVFGLRNGKISMGGDHINNPLLFYPTAFAGIFMMLVFSILIKPVINNRILKYVLWFGRNSYNAMAIHCPIKGVVVVLMAYIIGNTQYEISSNYYLASIAFVISLFLTLIGIVFINFIKNKYKH